jgi:predicted dehydrogenase
MIVDEGVSFMKKVKWGIMSTAGIGLEKVIPAMQKGEFCDIVAIASQSLEKAKAAAKELGISRAYGSYEELLADPDIDAVYIPLPNHLHVPWAIKTLEADKHVLCEKPISLNPMEAEELIKAAGRYPRLKVMEAFMYRLHPQWQRAKELVVNGKIGELQTIQSFFSYFNADPENIRNQADIGGGGLMDIGCYCVSLSRYIFAAEPTRVCGVSRFDDRFKTDKLTTGILDFDQGIATFTCSTQLISHQRVNICGTEGMVEIEIPFNAPADQPCRLWHKRGNEIEEMVFDVCDQYTLQGDQFALAVINDTEVPTSLEDAVANMKVIDNIVKSAASGTWSNCE